MQHDILYKLMNKKLHQAPLDNPQTVLDVGTGTGLWAIEFADEYHEAAVTGVDLRHVHSLASMVLSDRLAVQSNRIGSHPTAGF
jgi:ubiquinone/menaquinone biosynthesis C-methylase UbiE